MGLLDWQYFNIYNPKLSGYIDHHHGENCHKHRDSRNKDVEDVGIWSQGIQKIYIIFHKSRDNHLVVTSATCVDNSSVF